MCGARLFIRLLNAFLNSELLYSFGRNSNRFEQCNGALFKICGAANQKKGLGRSLSLFQNVVGANPRETDGLGERALGRRRRGLAAQKQLQRDVPKSRNVPPPVAQMLKITENMDHHDHCSFGVTKKIKVYLNDLIMS